MSKFKGMVGRAASALRRPVALAMAAVLVAGPLLGAFAPAAAAAGGTAYVETGRQIFYGNGGHTNVFTVNGVMAFCSDPHNDTPHSGTYPMTDAKTRPGNDGAAHPIEMLKAVAYYGWGMPGFDRSMWPATDWDGTPITDDEFYAYTHILIADHMWRSSDKGLAGTAISFRRWFCHNLLGYAWGTPGVPVTNENAFVFQAYRRGAPADFRLLELDTGNNSIYRPGYKSQTILTFEPKVGVRFTKTSAEPEFTASNPEYSVAGAEYDIFDASDGSLVTHIVMDASGRAEYRLLPNKRYYAVETKAPKGYKLNPERIEFTTGNTSSDEQLADDPGMVYFTIKKKDASTLGPAQIGATLEGAEYKLIDANGNTQLAKSNKNGFVFFDYVPFGKVTVTEVKAPQGYKLDPTPKEYYISSDSPEANGGIIELEPEDDFKESVIAFDIEIAKYADLGNEGSGLQNPAEGVRFDIISGTTGEVVGSIATGADGFASTEGLWFGEGERREGISGALPYDAKGYTVREDPATLPPNYAPAGEWKITPEQMADGAELRYIVDNDTVTSRVQVVKVDAGTGQSVPLAGFTFELLDAGKNPITQEVWYPNHAELSEFTTDGSGMVTFPEALLPGTYYIREKAAQPPYLLNGEDLEVVIPDVDDLAPLTVVRLPDEQAMGRATIVKTCSDDGAGLEGAEYDVIALEDVVSPDGSVRAVEGEIIDRVATGADGSATTRELYLGAGSARYAFVETRAPAGHVLDATPHEFTLAYADQATPVVEARVDAADDPTRVTVHKTDGGTGEALEGAGFALWAASDEIPAASDGRDVLAVRAPEGADVRAVRVVDHARINMTAEDGLELALRDEGGDEVERGADGTWTVPQGVYTMTASRGGDEVASVEVKAREGRGYDLALGKGLLGPAISVEELVLEWDTQLEWSGPDGAHLAFGLEGEQRILVDGRAVGTLSLEGDVYAEVDGAELAEAPVLLKGGVEPDVHVTDGSGLIDVRHLPAGEYRLREVSAPEGYLVDRAVRSFTISDEGLVDGHAVHEVSVADDYTKLELSKLDVADESEIEGARMALLDAGGEVVEEWVSDGAPHRVERVAPGAYTLVEEMTPREYDQATAVDFEVLPTGAVQRVAMHDEPIGVSAEVDKRQQIADPTAEDTVADGDGANRAEVTVSEEGAFDYSVDFRSTASTWVDEFTVDDDLTCAADGLAVLDSITLPAAGDDFDGRLNVWYRTDGAPDGGGDPPAANATLHDGHENPWLSDPSNAESLGDDGRALDYTGWRLWAADVSAVEAARLEVSDLGLPEGEAVTGIRLEYGRVEEGFSSRTGGWDRDDLKDPHDDVAGEMGPHADDSLEVPATAVVTLRDGTEAEVDAAALGRAEDGAGWMLDMDGDGAPEFYPEESVSIAGGSVERSPLVLHMRVTGDYKPGTELRNTASAHAYRNGGGSGLEGHDADGVVQTPKSALPPLDQTGAFPARLALAAAAALGSLAALAAWRRRRPASAYSTDCFGRRM